MSDTAEPDESAPPDPLDEFRDAAGALIASLKRLAEAAEQVVDDPETFARVTAGGRAVVEAFLGGFVDHAGPDDEGPHLQA